MKINYNLLFKINYFKIIEHSRKFIHPQVNKINKIKKIYFLLKDSEQIKFYDIYFP